MAEVKRKGSLGGRRGLNLLEWHEFVDDSSLPAAKPTGHGTQRVVFVALVVETLPS